jgi:hypothetical protein
LLFFYTFFDEVSTLGCELEFPGGLAFSVELFLLCVPITVVAHAHDGKRHSGSKYECLQLFHGFLQTSVAFFHAVQNCLLQLRG